MRIVKKFLALILAVVFAIVEISTFNLVSIWFCGGSLAGMIAALLGADPLLQLLIAVGISGVLLALVLIFKPFDTFCQNKCNFYSGNNRNT